MLNHQMIKRLLAGGLVIAAASFPTVAQARWAEDPGGSPSAAQVPVTAPQPASEVVAVPSGEGGGSSFQWEDAGIGAAGAVVLMSAGALGTGVARRRRGQRPVVG